jgi:hypothetical protein
MSAFVNSRQGFPRKATTLLGLISNDVSIRIKFDNHKKNNSVPTHFVIPQSYPFNQYNKTLGGKYGFLWQ